VHSLTIFSQAQSPLIHKQEDNLSPLIHIANMESRTKERTNSPNGPCWRFTFTISCICPMGPRRYPQTCPTKQPEVETRFTTEPITAMEVTETTASVHKLEN